MIEWTRLTRMLEQFEDVGKMKEVHVHMTVPSLNEDLLQKLELKLRNLQGNVTLHYLDSSYKHQMKCTIESFDDWNCAVNVVKDSEVITVPFDYIYCGDKFNYFCVN